MGVAKDKEKRLINVSNWIDKARLNSSAFCLLSL